MKLVKSTWLRLRSLIRGRFDRDLGDEYRFHVEMSAEDYVAEGMDPEEARRRAAREFGNATVLKETSRDMFTFARVESWLQDLRFGVRVLRKNAAFSLTAILTLALGIGVNVAIFSVVYGVLLRPLPYQDGTELVVLHQEAPRAGRDDVPFSAQEIFDYRDMNQTLDRVVEHHSMNFLLLGENRAERVDTAVVSANFFDVLGVQPLLGRTFIPDDDTLVAEGVIVLSHEYWQNRHGGDPEIVGKVFEMNDRPHRVIGVLPPIPQYPVENEVYMPTSHCPTRSSPGFIANRQSRMMTAFGRLKPGVSVEQAQADLATIAARLQQSYPEAYPEAQGYGLRVAPLRDDLTRHAETALLVLLGAAGFVLLIACANVANLLLARLLKIHRELSLRMALGAARARLVRQLLTESMLLSLGGGILGVLLAPLASRLLVDFASRFTTRANEVQIDTPVLLFAILVSLGAGLVFGLGPAVSSSRGIGEALKQGGDRLTTNRPGQRLRGGLVVAQIAVSFVLLIGAGLMIRSFVKLQQTHPGFNTEPILTMRLSPNFTRLSAHQDMLDFADEVLRTVRAVPGVESAALGSGFPFRPGGIATGPDAASIGIVGRPQFGPESRVDVDTVSVDYFNTIGQATLQGRTFTSRDDSDSPVVAVVNDTLAREWWQDESPLGNRIQSSQTGLTAEIVGVVSDVREYGLDRPAPGKVYLAVAQHGFTQSLVVRSSGQPSAVASSIRAALVDLDSEMAVDQVATMEALREESVASPRLMTMLLGLFALLALAISASGIAAVMALMVSQRTHELGIRMTLGASRREVLLMVLGRGLRLAAAGTVLGLLGAVGLSRLLSSLLYETQPTDVLTFASVALLFLTVSTLACLVPARRVIGIDPLAALRQE